MSSGLCGWRSLWSPTREGPWAGAVLEGSGNLLETPALCRTPLLLLPSSAPILPHPRSSAPAAEPTPEPLSTTPKAPSSTQHVGISPKIPPGPSVAEDGRDAVSGLMGRPAAFGHRLHTREAGATSEGHQHRVSEHKQKPVRTEKGSSCSWVLAPAERIPSPPAPCPWCPAGPCPAPLLLAVSCCTALPRMPTQGGPQASTSAGLELAQEFYLITDLWKQSGGCRPAPALAVPSP